MKEARNVDTWKSIIRQWIKRFPSGTIFRSKDVYSWVASGGVELSQGDLKPLGGTGREVWRHRLSRALCQLNRGQELLHPGISSQAWRVP